MVTEAKYGFDFATGKRRVDSELTLAKIPVPKTTTTPVVEAQPADTNPRGPKPSRGRGQSSRRDRFGNKRPRSKWFGYDESYNHPQQFPPPWHSQPTQGPSYFHGYPQSFNPPPSQQQYGYYPSPQWVPNEQPPSGYGGYRGGKGQIKAPPAAQPKYALLHLREVDQDPLPRMSPDESIWLHVSLKLVN